MIMEIFCIIALGYLFFGFLLWVIPFDSGVGYVDCAFTDYNILFIPFWLPALFSERIQEAISK